MWNSQNLLMDGTNAYIYAGGDAPAEQVSLTTGTPVYLVTDSLGSVRGAVNSSGTLTGTAAHDAWGNPLTAGGLTATTPFGYAGGYTDPDGLIYLIDRYYDPQTGQFTSLDPDVDETLDPYGYTDGNPVSNTDPSGDSSCSRKDKCTASQGDTANPDNSDGGGAVPSARGQYALKVTYDVIKGATSGHSSSATRFRSIHDEVRCWNNYSMSCIIEFPGESPGELFGDAAAVFGTEVCPNCQWDASSPVRRNVDKITAEKYEFHWAIRITAHEMVYETVFGNIAFGYLGERLGFGEGTLQKAGGAFDKYKGFDDSGNYIQRQMGIRLYHLENGTVHIPVILDDIIYGLYHIAHDGVHGLAAHTRYACPYDQKSLNRAESGWPC